ncbi:MAG: hypothetical protein JNL90_04905 [Planctomycetes bacterium]|nr:hypothetical protein [Planctomycetota bacterium]
MSITQSFPNAAQSPVKPVASYDSRVSVPDGRFNFRWGAVLAGLAIAIACNVFFAEIGLCLNLGIIDRNSSGGAVAVANAIAWLVTGLAALFGGAWVAGHMSSSRTRVEGGLHGLAVWAAGAVVMLALAFTATGVVGSGMLSLVGKGLEGAGKAAALAMPTWDGIKQELDGALQRNGADPAAMGGSGDAATGIAAADPQTRLLDRSRLFELAGRHFTIDGATPPANERDELVRLIASQAGISPAVAERTLAQWDRVWDGGVQRYEEAKAEAARVAEEARGMAMVAAGWAAAAMLLGAIAALIGGAIGSSARLRSLACEPLPVVRA